MRIAIQVVAFALSAATASACSSSSTGTGSTTAGDAGTVATFTQVYADVLSPQCGMACHNPAGIGVTGGKLDMSSQATAYTNLVNVGAMGEACSGMGTRVVPGSADTSILYEKVDPDGTAPCGGHMPLGGTPISDAEASEIKSWINAGAPQN